MQKIQELITEEIIAQKLRLFLWCPVFFAIGIALYFGMKTEPSRWVGFGASLALGAGLFALWKIQGENIYLKAIYLAIMGLLFIALGFFTAQTRSHLVYTPMIEKKISPVGVIGVIDSLEQLDQKKGSRVVLTDLDIERLDSAQTPRKIRLTIRKDEGLATGQKIKILAHLNPPGGPVAPGAFDFQRMAYFQGVGAVGFAFSQPDIIEQTQKNAFNLKTLRENIGHTIADKTAEPQQSIVIALMTGQRGAITDRDWQALRDSGLAHLLAISGLHVGMVAGVLFFFSRLIMACMGNLALHYPIKKYAALIALIGAFFYTLIVGATIPTQRALLMTGLVMVAIMLDRSPFSLRLVALAALVVLVISPESLTSVSFQMSFAAVTALICFYEWLRPVWSHYHRRAGVFRRVILYFVGVSLTTVIAGLATGLFALFHFQNFAVYGVLANMIAVPLMAFIVMPIIVLSYVLMPLGLSEIPLSFVEWGVGWILATAHFVAGLEGAVWHVPAWPHWIFIGMVLCLWTLMIWQGRLKIFVLPILALLISLVFIYRQPDILVSDRAELVALQSEDKKLWLSTAQKQRYVTDNWMRRYGLAGQDKSIWPKEGTVEAFPLSCDPYGCRGEVKGQKLAVSYTRMAWQEDCHWADIIISQVPVEDQNCNARTIIDYFDVWRNGAYALWLTPNKVKIQTVENVRGKRLWTQTSSNNKN